MYQYLLDATIENPKLGFGGSRTCAYGLQRTPLGTTTYLKCNSAVNDLAPFLFLFFVTNAMFQVVVVSDNVDIKDFCARHGVKTTSTMDRSFLKPGDNYIDIVTPFDRFPMVGNFVTTLFPVGHIKSTIRNDKDFVNQVCDLKKWLRLS